MGRLLRRTWVRVGLVAFVLAGGVGLYLTQPWRLFFDRTVHESAPAAVATASGAPQVVASGTFVSHEHATRGRASVVRLPDGGRVLRIEGLDTSDGPDLRVWLSDQPVREGRAGWFAFGEGRHVELGKLKGNKGDQNYTVPADADLARLTSVSIWCKRFGVSFGAAALRA
ncbi:DM13 domain-containing protein [Actinomadura kijaniata]|uniref:DM13 domain-containing protein n=1 Tax=Actinomadura namibiensis TaxID=182080 RepID=A0A7W3LMD4_ACTNM|nr:DM13 domain-containing protein [Actinomadura namibiensis]MBA8950767.1 hypothetical protein [Actinomadura namibiensis]